MDGQCPDNGNECMSDPQCGPATNVLFKCKNEANVKTEEDQNQKPKQSIYDHYPL